MLLTDLKISISSEGGIVLPFEANLEPLLAQLNSRITSQSTLVSSGKSVVNQIPREAILRVLSVPALDQIGGSLFWLALLEVFFVRIVNSRPNTFRRMSTDARSMIVQHFRSQYLEHSQKLLLELALQQRDPLKFQIVSEELKRGQLKLSVSAWLVVCFAHVGFLVLLENFPLNAPELMQCKDGVVSRLAAFMHAELNAPCSLNLSTALAMSHALAAIFPPVLVDLNRTPLDGTTQRSSSLKELLSQGRSDEVMTNLWKKLTHGDSNDKHDIHDLSGILTMKRPYTEQSIRALGVSRVADCLMPNTKLVHRTKEDDVSLAVHEYRETHEFVIHGVNKKNGNRAQSAPAERTPPVARRPSVGKRRLALSSSAEVQNAIAFEDLWMPPPKLETGLSLYNVSPGMFDSKMANDKMVIRLTRTLNLSKNGSFATYLQNFDMFGNPRRVPMKTSNFNVLPDMSVEIYEKEELARDMVWKQRLWSSYK